MNEIITKIYNDKKYNKAIKDICTRNNTKQYIDELKQEVFIILLDKEDSFIEGLYNSNGLLKYFCKIAYNQIKSSTSPFALNIRDKRRSKIKYEGSEYYNDYMIDMGQYIIDMEVEEIESPDRIDYLNILNYVKENKFLTHIEMELFIYYFNLERSFIEDICTKRSYRYIADELGFSRTYIQKTMMDIKIKIVEHLRTSQYSKYINTNIGF